MRFASRPAHFLAVLSLVLAAVSPAAAADTLIQYLSGTGPGDAVQWDFFCTDGRNSRVWSKIAVPSCWEQQGFGTYNYGGELMSDDGPLGNEQGLYRREFTVPANWRGKVVRLVFDGAMTDTSVWINGQSAGPTHSGAFYRFRYDITPLLKFGEKNLIEVTVAKTSAVRSVNDAERAADYWVFGGIFRPVWLEALPPPFIDRTAIDARADGQFFAEVHLGEKLGAGAQASAQVFDADHRPVGEPIAVTVSAGAAKVEFRGQFPGIRTWTAETPHLYTVQFTLSLVEPALRAGSPESDGAGARGEANPHGVRVPPQAVHRVTERFGFRTIEVRKNDGVYLNGAKIVLKGVNRHCFWPETARTVSREQSYADARLIKAANLNAVRMSHYPPDSHFLEACDELGLYVLDELAGWQKAYATEPGRRLIGELIQRDVNHPSILFWDNGNEGGWNTENDGEFAQWDPQRRPVLHPWAVHDEIDTNHYEKYDSTVKLSAGPQIFMPTEFLHGLYDGGIGAGFRDYWDVMGRSPTVAGGFFWVWCDEGVVRTDQNGRIDNAGNLAPDGMVGPHREKEGSYFAVQEIWSPVQAVLPERLPADFDGKVRVENGYSFTNLSVCKFAWSLVRFPGATDRAGKVTVVASGELPGPNVAPRQTGEIVLPLGAKLAGADALHLTAKGPVGEELWTWSAVLPAKSVQVVFPAKPKRAEVKEDERKIQVRTSNLEVTFSKETGLLTGVRSGGKTFSLANGPRLVAMRRNDRLYEEGAASERIGTDLRAVRSNRVKKIQWMAGEDVVGATVSVRFEPDDFSVRWDIGEDGRLRAEYDYDFTGEIDVLGVRFDYPEANVKSKRWLGRGPYPVYQNRMGGGVFDVHEVAYNDPIPGQTYAYPEFKGYFRDWRWLELQTTEGRIVVENDFAALAGEVVEGDEYGPTFFGLFGPKDGEPPMLALPDVGLAFLDVIPAMRNKFASQETLGPQSQPRKVSGVRHGSVTFRFLPD